MDSHPVPTMPLGSTVPSLGGTDSLPYLIPSCWGQCPGKAQRPSSSLCRQVKQKQMVFFSFNMSTFLPPLLGSLLPCSATGGFQHRLGMPLHRAAADAWKTSPCDAIAFVYPRTNFWQTAHKLGWKHEGAQETKLFATVKSENSSAGFFSPGKSCGYAYSSSMRSSRGRKLFGSK